MSLRQLLATVLLLAQVAGCDVERPLITLPNPPQILNSR